MRDEVWKIGKGVLMCFLSRSLDALCLGRARLSMANRFPQSLRELFLKARVQRGTVTSGCMTRKWSTQPLKFWTIDYHRRGGKLHYPWILFSFSKRPGLNKTLLLTECHQEQKIKRNPYFPCVSELLLPDIKAIGTVNSNTSECFHKGSFLQFINCGL